MRINIILERLNNLKLWWLFFLYTFFVSVFVQMVLLPYVFPHLHAGYGLLNSSLDSIGFHQLAVDLANKIHIQGWSAWQLSPGGQSPAGIASIFYFFILPDPRIFIPISAALHASAALILFNLLNLFLKNKSRVVLCVLPFLAFPSNMQWTAQWHRDGFSILGVVLILQGMVLTAKLLNYRFGKWSLDNFYVIISYLCGFILILVARPYLLTIIEPFVKLFFFTLSLLFLIETFKKELPWKITLFVLLSMLLIVFVLGRLKTNIGSVEFKESASVSDSANADDEEEYVEEYEAEEIPQPVLIAEPLSGKLSLEEGVTFTDKGEVLVAPGGLQPAVVAKPTTQITSHKISQLKTKKRKIKVKKLIKNDYIEDHWRRSFWLPLSVENKAYNLAVFRKGFRLSSPEAKSNIDRNIGFGSIKDELIYLPRAAQIVFLAPFPNQWFASGSCAANSLMRRISVFEMTVVYFALIFLPYGIWLWRKRIEIWIISIFCIYMMLVYGLVVCNIGSLYRMRYVYITILVALGIAGFIALLEQLKPKS